MEPVLVVGAGPTGLTLATELCLTGVKPLVLERLTDIRQVAKAGLAHRVLGGLAQLHRIGKLGLGGLSGHRRPRSTGGWLAQRMSQARSLPQSMLYASKLTFL